jgi:hypothetical protein
MFRVANFHRELDIVSRAIDFWQGQLECLSFNLLMYSNKGDPLESLDCPTSQYYGSVCAHYIKRKWRGRNGVYFQY